MKKILLPLLFSFLLFLPAVVKAESIKSFEVSVGIFRDSSIEVEEKILYDFGEFSRHGIFRDIPYSYKARGGNYKLNIEVISVTDKSGKPYIYKVSKNSGVLNIKIGDPNSLVNKENYYVIKYRVKKALNYFSDHDELYWNVTGSEWLVPMQNVSASVYLENSTLESGLMASCFFGSVGSTEPCSSYKISAGRADYYEPNVPEGQGLTIVFGWPKGLVSEPTLLQKIMFALQDNWAFGIVPLTLLFLILHWFSKGRDPKVSKIIVPEYTVPDSLSAAEVGTIFDEKASAKDVTAEIINLAVLGYLKITKLEKVELVFIKTTDYKIDLLKPYTDLENEFQKKICKGLFESVSIVKTTTDSSGKTVVEERGKNSVNLSDLKEVFYKDLAEIQKELYEQTVKKGYFVSNPQKIRTKYLALAVFLAIFGFIFGVAVANIFLAISIFISGVLIGIFGFLMPARTLKGAEAKRKILGLKLFLSVTEKDRLKFHNAPEKTFEQFEKFMPFALALGVEESWAKQFEGLFKNSPSWYSDSTGMNFNSVLFASSLRNFSGTATSALASSPSSSASSGGSGFSGGGSGGGFGGGGGGSW